jgi:hypothetical protein
MPLYRGDGGAGDASTDAYASQIATYAQTATTKANEASASASAASSSASAASTAQTAAELAETNAETAQVAAETAQTAAELAENNAETAENNAASSASAASTSATNASNSASSASTSATNASNSASAASTSATNASNSASAASTSATNAASSASAASTSASNASTSATAAQSAQSAAEVAQAAAEAAQESIDGFFLGAQTSNPTVDLNGNAVTAGDWYFNTTDSTTRIYDGSTWNTVNPDLIGDTSPQLGGNLDLNSNDITGTGNVNITGNVSLTGTVDGRDVAADGTKLDGIEALADVTDTTNVTAAGALMDSELTNITAIKALDQGVATTDSPTFESLIIEGSNVTLASFERTGGGFGAYNVKFNADHSELGDNYYLGINLGGGFYLSRDDNNLSAIFTATSTGLTVSGTVAATNVTSGGDNVLTTTSVIDGGTY